LDERQNLGLISGTNDSSIVSKRSVERTGYAIKAVEHQWFRHFVKKPVRRAPLINLGYFVRMRAIEKAVDEVQPIARVHP
jgi:tRNA wybutosine-synthesizing protein 4